MLIVKDHKKVSKALSGVASKWRLIGLSLGLPQYVLENVEQSYPTLKEQVGGMVREWLSRAGSDASWQKLIEILRSGVVAENSLAHELESKYCSGSTASASASSSSGSTGSGGKQGQSGNGEKPSLQDLIPIPLSHKQCRELGVHLRIPKEILRKIESENPDNERKHKRALFKSWLERDSDPSWSRLLTALGHVDQSLRDKVRDTYDVGGQNQGPRGRPNTEHIVREAPLSSSDKPVTMPIKTRPKKSAMEAPREASPDSLVRSSSSSYHSASNYDEPDEHFSSAHYPSNVEHAVPRSLVQSKGPAGSSDKRAPLRRHLQSHDSVSSGHISSDSTTTLSSDQATPKQLQSRFPLSSADGDTPTSSPKHASADMGGTSPKVSHRGEISLLLVEEFRAAVRVWNNEAAERVLVKDERVVDTVFTTEDNRTALMLAAAADKPKMARILLKYKASTTATDKNGMTALFLACSHGNYEVMKLLVVAFANVNASARDGTPMLLTPAQKGFSMVTQYLLENDANPNIANADGVTPLMAAAKKGQRDVVKVLLTHGADVTAVSVKASRTALQEAIDSDHQEIVRLLMAASKEAKERSQHLFVCKSAEVVRSLVQNNAKVDERRGDQATPLIVQVENGNEEVVRELLLQRANVDLQDNEGESALMKASARGLFSITQLIIAHRAILDLKSKAGYTAVMYAVKGDHVGIVRELLLAGADPTVRNKDGQTALELAMERKSEAMVEEIKKHTSIADSKDPFINLLAGYLDKFSSKQKPQQRSIAPAPRASSDSSGDAHHPVGAAREHEEESPLKEQLNKAWKRIADLETRVHDLTLQTTVEISDDTDLTYYDRSRLESEFRKVKELKHKAEQYAVEAKQTAQRLSAENFKLKEDLSREQHLNELERKNMLREMESKLGTKGGEDEREDAKKEIVEQTIHQKALELATTMKGPSRKVLVDFEMIKDLILNQTVTANMVLLVTGGLPYSGKSTLINKLVNASASSSRVREALCLSELQAVILRHGVSNSSIWMTTPEQQKLLVRIALLHVSLQRQQSSVSFTPQKKPVPVFGDAKLDNCFFNVFNDLQKCELKTEEQRWSLTTGDLSFLTVWDIGVSKAVYDVVGLLVPNCTKCIFLDHFSLNHDADSMDQIPDLGSECYKGRYEHRNEVMKLKTKLTYLCYPLFVVPDNNESTLLVGTHSGLPDSEVKQKSRHVLELVKNQVRKRKRSHVLAPHVVSVQHQKKEDIAKLQKTIEGMIASNSQYRVELPLKWGFLRTYLSYTRALYITLPDLKAVAHYLHMTDGEVKEFLKLFTECGSLIHIISLCPECADEFVILRPAEFLNEVEKLYYVAKDQVSETLMERRDKGYISKELIEALLLKQVQLDPSKRCSFFIHAIRRLDIISALKPASKYRIGRQADKEQEMFFMPTIRPKPLKTEPSDESLFLPHTVVFRYPLQSEILVYIQQELEECVEFDPMNCFNTLRFKNKTGVGSEHLTLHFMGGYIEVTGKNFSNRFRSTIKTACIEMMAGLKRTRPKLALKYGLAILCPRVAKKQVTHFVKFHPLEDVDELYCDKCVSMVWVEGECREWIRAKYTGPSSLVKYSKDILRESETMEIADSLCALSIDKIIAIASNLGFNREEVKQRAQHIPQKPLTVELLLEFSKRTPFRVRRRLGQVLMNSGLWKEALKIYPSALQTCLYKRSQKDDFTPQKGFTAAADDLPSLRELRLVAMHLPDWEKVGGDLQVDKETLKECRVSNRTTCEMAYQMLLKWLEGGSGQRTRTRLINVLIEHKCESNAEFLRVGEQDHYWK